MNRPYLYALVNGDCNVVNMANLAEIDSLNSVM